MEADGTRQEYTVDGVLKKISKSISTGYIHRKQTEKKNKGGNWLTQLHLEIVDKMQRK